MAKQLALYGIGIDGKPRRPPARGILAQKFVVPPFSVLNARDGFWMARKRAWHALGIVGTAGRNAGSGVGEADKHAGVTGGSPGPHARPGYEVGKKKDEKAGTFYNIANDEYVDGRRNLKQGSGGYGYPQGVGEANEDGVEETLGASCFDPVLCELMYRWFCPPGGAVLDPFAGGATSGIVAAVMGLDFTGVEFRPGQIEVDLKQAAAVGVQPTWVLGDSAKLDAVLDTHYTGKRKRFDFLWSDPPYYDLEVYSDHGADGSAKQTYPEFMEWYRGIFAQAVGRVREDSFVAVKIGEFRDARTGEYRNFVGDNITVFKELGLKYYNEIILQTSVGSLSIRAAKQMQCSRKIGKSHQNILVFWKGDLKRIPEVFGDVWAE